MDYPNLKCSFYVKPETFERCPRPAVVHLVSEGKDVPGCYYCQEHADEILEEYARHVGIVGHWTSRPLEVTR